jgi:hypothetical protein
MPVKFDVAVHRLPQAANQMVGAQIHIRSATPTHHALSPSRDRPEHIRQIAAQAVFGAEARFDPLTFEPAYDLAADFDDLLQAFAMTVLAHIGRRADVDVYAIYAAVYRQAGLSRRA